MSGSGQSTFQPIFPELTTHLSAISPGTTALSLTKLLPALFPEFVRDTAQWTRRLLELLPSLTHLGLSYVYPKEPDQNEVEEDIRVYEVLLRTVSTCQTPCVQVTALRLTGRAVTRLDAYVNAARRIDEDWAMRRVRFWVDERVIEDWTVERELLIDDARLERSIWTEAKPLSLYVVAAIAAT
ncbi:hypothetical protein BKA62DRAFT_487929 [Auriculariales sp. MPI-PUGE-AT-0066]|nr:hypothetical protein BKA62DRAFT_487929 [Auriculariales sp. MPI-PUGE-AT-0066]